MSKKYHLDAELIDVNAPEYFATEAAQITHLGPVTRITFVSAKLCTNGRPLRETVCSVVMPTEMVKVLAEHIRTGIPPRAQAAVGWEDGGFVEKPH